jgi:uncharacterized protein (TIGR02285 family)
MFPKFLITLVMVLFGLGFFETTHAKEKITWPYLCYYPLYICENSRVVGGAGWDILNLMWKNMPQYNHEAVLLPVKRILKDMKEGKHYLFYGLYKTPEREKYVYFSLPCRISTPTMVVIRKDEIQRFGMGKSVSLKRLLEDKLLKFLMFSEISFGSGTDDLLKTFGKAENVYTEYRTDKMNQYALDLLLNKRIDYFLALNGTRHRAGELGMSDEIAFIPIKEQKDYKVGHITAPKNDWGKRVIQEVNQVLKKQVSTEYFFNLFTPLVSDNMVPELRRQFNRLIVEPSKQ